MNNAPFHIGQKVVCIKWFGLYSNPDIIPLQKDNIYTVSDIQQHRYVSGWAIELEEMIRGDYYYHIQFAPIETNYSDATNEILEKFPLEVGGTPDKIIAPTKVTCD